MQISSRRRFLLGVGSTVLLAACDNSTNARGAEIIDARVDATLDYLRRTYPNIVPLEQSASAMLIMPLVTEAGFLFGASYGRGALRIDGVSVDYYAAASGSLGFQIGVQQYAHVIYFRTDAALREFRASPGWVGDAKAEYALLDSGGRLSANEIDATRPVLAVVFGQVGLAAGISLEGTKYSRIVP